MSKPTVEVWHDDVKVFAKTFRSGKEARQALRSRVEAFLHLKLPVAVALVEGSTEEDAWKFDVEHNGVTVSIRLLYDGADG